MTIMIDDEFIKSLAAVLGIIFMMGGLGVILLRCFKNDDIGEE